MSIDRILVPDDFSDHASDALDHAIGLALKHGARIDLAHAYGAPAATLSPYGSAFPADLMAGLRDAAKEKIAADAERVRQAGIEVDTRLSKRTPQDALPLIAQDLGSDLIVMGTRGFGGLKQVLLGSVAASLVRTAPCPVMTVPGPRRGTGPLRFDRILLPTDFSTAAGRTIDVAKALAGAGPDGSEIVLAHAIYVPQEVQAYLHQEADPTLGDFSAPQRQQLSDLASELSAEGFRARAEMLPGRPEEAIGRAAHELEVDLVIMGTHGRSGISHWLLGSVAERVLRTSDCPTVTVTPG